jgi:hypothetical protein
VKDCRSGWERRKPMPGRIVTLLGAPVNEENTRLSFIVVFLCSLCRFRGDIRVTGSEGVGPGVF